MKSLLALLLAGLCLLAANSAREVATAMRSADELEAPYTPSAEMAPIVSLGFREAAADVLWIRFLGYFGSFESDSSAVADLVDAIVALDPDYHRIYEAGARAITFAGHGVTQASLLRALAILDKGMAQFPEDWKLPDLAGDIYTQDLVTNDPAQRRKWDERGTHLIEQAIRMPGAPPEAATWAATMRTKLGQQERAIKNLREMVLLTSDPDARQRMIDKLATMVDANKDALEAELSEMGRRFNLTWRRERRDVPATMFVLIGPHSPESFDLTDLATGGRDLIGANDPPPLEPLD